MRKLTITFAVLAVSTLSVHARLGQPQFNLEKELRKKLPIAKHTDESKQSYSGTLSFGNAKLTIKFRGEITLPMNTKADYVRYTTSSGEVIQMSRLPYEYNKYKSAHEELIFTQPVTKEQALKYVKRLLPKSVKKFKAVDSNKYIAKEYSKLIHIELTMGYEAGQDMVTKVSVAYDKEQMDKAESEERSELYQNIYKRVKVKSRNDRRNLM